MFSNKKEEMTPFEKARQNLKKFAESANILQSVHMLVAVAESMKGVQPDEKEILEEMFKAVMEDISLYIEERGDKWN